MSSNTSTLKSGYPEIYRAIVMDGAIRLMDGRYSRGFVDDRELLTCLSSGLLVKEYRDEMAFAVLPKEDTL